MDTSVLQAPRILEQNCGRSRLQSLQAPFLLEICLEGSRPTAIIQLHGACFARNMTLHHTHLRQPSHMAVVKPHNILLSVQFRRKLLYCNVQQHSTCVLPKRCKLARNCFSLFESNLLKSCETGHAGMHTQCDFEFSPAMSDHIGHRPARCLLAQDLHS